MLTAAQGPRSRSRWKRPGVAALRTPTKAYVEAVHSPGPILPAPLHILIDPSAWKGYSAKSVVAISEPPTLTADGDALCTKPPKRVATLAIVTISQKPETEEDKSVAYSVMVWLVDPGQQAHQGEAMQRTTTGRSQAPGAASGVTSP